METIKSYLSNPYVMAAVIAGGVYIGMEIMTDDMPIGSMNLALIAAAIYLFIKYRQGALRMPFSGGALPMRARNMNHLYAAHEY